MRSARACRSICFGRSWPAPTAAPRTQGFLHVLSPPPRRLSALLSLWRVTTRETVGACLAPTNTLGSPLAGVSRLQSRPRPQRPLPEFSAASSPHPTHSAPRRKTQRHSFLESHGLSTRSAGTRTPVLFQTSFVAPVLCSSLARANDHRASDFASQTKRSRLPCPSLSPLALVFGLALSCVRVRPLDLLARDLVRPSSFSLLLRVGATPRAPSTHTGSLHRQSHIPNDS